MNYAIIAAGEGSRLVQEGVKLPKPLVDLDGRPMIGRLIDIFMNHNPESLSIIVNEQMTEVADYLRSRSYPVGMRLTVKSTPSSMHSFWEVSRDFAPGKFVLTTVDTIFREDDFARYVEAWENDADGCDGYMAVTPFIDVRNRSMLPLTPTTASPASLTASKMVCAMSAAESTALHRPAPSTFCAAVSTAECRGCATISVLSSMPD